MGNLLDKKIGRRSLLKGLGIVSLMPLIPEVMAMPINRPPYKYNFKYSDLQNSTFYLCYGMSALQPDRLHL